MTKIVGPTKCSPGPTDTHPLFSKLPRMTDLSMSTQYATRAILCAALPVFSLLTVGSSINGSPSAQTGSGGGTV